MNTMTDIIDNKIELFHKWIDESKNIVFFGGAGVSTESGIKDFRSVDGLYNESYSYPPEMILSHTFFMKNTEEFYRFYRDKMVIEGVKPNKTHYALAELESSGKLKGVITQNIDDLHEQAGSKNVIHLHGIINDNHCMRCHKYYPLSKIGNKGVPRCSCGGVIKPDVVLYEECLDTALLKESIRLIENADMFIVGGTSLVVNPASSLVYYYSGKKLVLINKSETGQDHIANLVIHDSLGKVW